MRDVVQFGSKLQNGPRRPAGLSEHTMLISLFKDGTPMMAFVKYLYRTHGIISVQHWDDAGGCELLDGFPLDDVSRDAFMKAVGVPERPRLPGGAEVVVLFPHA